MARAAGKEVRVREARRGVPARSRAGPVLACVLAVALAAACSAGRPGRPALAAREPRAGHRGPGRG